MCLQYGFYIIKHNARLLAQRMSFRETHVFKIHKGIRVQLKSVESLNHK